MMVPGKKCWSLIWLGTALAAMVLLSAGLPALRLLPGRPFPLRALGLGQSNGLPGEALPSLPFPSIGVVAVVALVAFIIVFTLWIITFILRPQARKRMLARLVSYLVGLLIIYMLFNLFWQLNLARLTEQNQPPASEVGELLNQAEAAPAPPAFIVDPPQWFITVITLILITLVLGLVWFLWRPRTGLQTSPVDLLVHEARQALDQLRAGSDLQDTVMRCYQEMSQILSQQRGLKRQKAMTPREFEAHLIEVGLRNEHIHRLTRLFERVRYGAGPSGEREAGEAVACLSAIIETYGRPA